jgi:hypothetical protein
MVSYIVGINQYYNHYMNTHKIIDILFGQRVETMAPNPPNVCHGADGLSTKIVQIASKTGSSLWIYVFHLWS